MLFNREKFLGIISFSGDAPVLPSKYKSANTHVTAGTGRLRRGKLHCLS
jgi:hypothetical protein